MTKEKMVFSKKEIARLHKVYDIVYDEHVKKGDTLVFAHLMAATKQTIEKNRILKEKTVEGGKLE